MLVYQPQINKWEANRIDFRSALAIKPTGAKEETFGVIFANARTQVDKVARTVVFEDLKITKTDFPTLPNHGAAYTTELQSEFAKTIRTISLDRLEASLALAGIKPPTVAVQNNPPQVIVSYSPAILVPIDGAPVLQPVPDHSRAKRVINTRALILQAGFTDALYMHVFDGWLTANGIGGPWTQAFLGPIMLKEANEIAQDLSKKGVVDLLDGGPKANPKPSLASGVPTIYTSQTPAELIVFKGQPDFTPIVGTELLWASNTTSDVLINTANNNYYALLAGRWFTAANLSGPWAFVASDSLPPDFAKIPAQSLAGAVLPTVAGTPQAQEAVIENSIPQTATVPLKNGPTFTPNFNGPPKLVAIPGTTLSQVQNSSEPIIEVSPNSYYSVVAGVWFTAPQLTGPWSVATTVPAVVYSIPPSSPIYYVTYVRIYEATPQYVYVGYTPGYLGTVVSPYGTVVYGTGYVYSPWIGTEWYPPPYTYGVAAAPVYNPYVGFTYGFALGLATAAWTEPYWGSYYYPAYWGGYHGYCCASASANVYGHWGATTYSGTRSWYAGGGVAGTTASGNYYNSRTGTSGSYNAVQAVQRLDRQRDARLRSHDERRRGRNGQCRAREQLQRLYRAALDRQRGVGHRRRRKHLQPRRSEHRGTGRQRARRRRIDVQREDRQHQHVGDRECRQQPLRRRQRQRVQEHRRRLAAAFVERLERHVRPTRPAPIAKRRRAAAATTAQAASAKRARCRARAEAAAGAASAAATASVVAASVATIASAAVVLVAAIASEAAVAGAGALAAAASAEEDSAVAGVASPIVAR